MTRVDFAAAQARVAARRHERDAATATRALHHRASTAHLPAALRGPAATALSYWDMILSRTGTRPAFRVGQVDAELLDEELLDLLQNQVGSALKLHGTHLLSDWSAEVDAALRAILFKLTIWDHDASYGASLQNLRYTTARGARPTAWQKTLHGLASVAGRYAWTKWEARLLDADAPDSRAARASDALRGAHRVAALASFVVFLVNGRHRTLLDRALGLRLRPTSAAVAHDVSFEYLNRQLVWHALTEFLLFLLPLVGIARWKRLLGRGWRALAALFARRASTGPSAENEKSRGELAFLPERTCPICYADQNPAASSEAEALGLSAGAGGGGGVGIVGSASTDVTSPYEALPCGCVYDYACLAARLDAADGEAWPCLRCGAGVLECRAWAGDVVVVERRGRRRSTGTGSGGSPAGKSVTFADEAEGEGESFVRLDPMPDVDEREREWGAAGEDEDGDDDGEGDDGGEGGGDVDPASSLVGRAAHREEVDT